MADYFKERDKENTKRLLEIRDDLPDFCEEFFIGIESLTSVLTRLGYAYDLRRFFDYLVKRVQYFRLKKNPKNIELRDLEGVTILHLEGFLEYLTYYEYNGKDFSNGERGKARKLSTVRTFFKYFYNKDKLSQNVASKVQMPKLHEKDIIRLESREVDRILDVAEDSATVSEHQRKILLNTRARDVAILTLLLGTGIRVSECVGLNIGDIDFDTNGFTVTRKGGNRAILYFGNEVREALLYYIEGERNALIARSQKLSINDKDALFLSLQIKRISVRAVENLVKKYASIAAPLKNISPHKLRSTYGTNLYRATGDIYMVADVLGHKDVNTTKKHYAAITEDRRKSAAKAVTLRNSD